MAGRKIVKCIGGNIRLDLEAWRTVYYEISLTLYTQKSPVGRIKEGSGVPPYNGDHIGKES